ncbi:uncharacterized protein F5Z01DRAFT_651478 [Emericellopsis atlantica]|uniref:Apple domain-containing protein n=1 Tax=Emericellopsis atlantica TaxID=2614577 RepID=A0A9P7ZPQ3_9HYPO|nr:uncharacterized protein F5Z01DRAFT_651478 [Emericellopsis atlantica]KAG9255542.1 hypothetical protein F5Z01DRAFT_651478 [Emericellopsis atlantica]
MDRTAGGGAHAGHVSGRSLTNNMNTAAGGTGHGSSHHARGTSGGGVVQQPHQRHRSLSNRPDLKPAPSGSSMREQAAATAKHQSSSAPPPPAVVATNGASVAKPQPAVFWNDKQSLEQSRTQEQTFYNDVTPPPSPSYGGGSKNSFSIGYPSLKGPAPVGLQPMTSAGSRDGGRGGYDYRWDHVAPQAPIPQSDRTCGLTKKFFWIAVGVAIGLLLAVAIGLGVGLSGNSSSSHGSQDSDRASSTQTVPTSTHPEGGSPATTVLVATATFTSTDEASEACPAANDTTFAVPNSPKTFRRFCGVDYRSAQGTTDLATVWTASMQDCMVNCAGFDGCTACAWGVQKGDNYRDNHRCYLKTDLGESQEVRDGWDFAILEE